MSLNSAPVFVMHNTLEIIQPDDWHVHFRDGELLAPVVAATARHFARAIVMPNLFPPVVTTSDAVAYRQRIEAASPSDQFTPLMTLYLTESSDSSDIVSGAADGIITAVKLYPAGATTNSASGVKSIDNVMPVLEAMADAGVVLCVHGEVTDPEIDIFDREARFLDTVLAPLQQRLPELRVVLEHVTTQDGVAYVESAGQNTAATITPHHLMINRNHLLAGGIRPHYYCLPVVKRQRHQEALRRAACGDCDRFFLGTDSAPHVDATKESACGCAGVFNAPTTLSCVAEVFEQENALHKLESFTSLNGPKFYRLPVNPTKIRLTRSETAIDFANKLTTPAGELTVFDPQTALHWSVSETR